MAKLKFKKGYSDVGVFPLLSHVLKEGALIVDDEDFELNTAASLSGGEKVKILQDGKTALTTTQDIANLAGGASSYSTDEIATGGTWIDGKPIYRIVIPFSLVNETNIVHNLSIDKYLSTIFNGYLQVEDNEHFFNGEINSNNGSGITVNLSNLGMITKNTNDLNIANDNSWISFNSYIILEYTKTTDTV